MASDRNSAAVHSRTLFERAKRVIPGGVNSPVRAFRGVGGDPIFIRSGHGAKITDVDGREFVDYVGSWGPLILGHAHPEVVQALADIARSGTSFGAPTEGEVELAELLSAVVPSLEMVRLVNSGTEATMSAIRLARAFTGRPYIIKCNGCYHGHADTLLVKAGSGVATLGIPGSPGVPKQIAELTLSVEFNDEEALLRAVESVGADQVAAIILEPVPGNMGLVLPRSGYLETVAEVCHRKGIVFICDEVMTGMRVALGGAQERFRFKPDLSTFGKVIGGGLPIGAFGGRRDIMSRLAPSGDVYQAGTLSGNPLAVQAGLATLRKLKRENPYPELEERTRVLADGFAAAASAAALPFQTATCGSMFGFFFSENPVSNYSDALRSDVPLFKRFYHAMLDEGIYLAPSAFEAGFVGLAHSREIIDDTVRSAKRAMAKLR